jgi:hypothetical protein
MTAYDAGECTDSLVAGAGASAALTGLVFVAVSINVDPILRLQGLPERALATVLLLPSVVSRIGADTRAVAGRAGGRIAGRRPAVRGSDPALTTGTAASREGRRVQTFGQWLLVGLERSPSCLAR